jgi:Fe-S oxidoreductase
MAKLKYEFLHNYYKTHGAPLRARMFANIAALSKWGSRLAPFSNWTLAMPPTRWAMHQFLGIHRKRKLPPFVWRTFERWFAKHKPQGDGHRGKVAFFVDTFTNFNYPAIGIATVGVLEKAGFEVVLAGNKCCGRPMISKGFLDEAKLLAQHNINALHTFAEQKIPVVGVEPSCLLTLRDDYPDLVPGKAAFEVARNAFMIEEFLQTLAKNGQLDLKFKNQPKKLLFHAHTFQKAIIGTNAALAMLAMPPGNEVKEMDGGECGMAGAFGYEKEHYDLANEIAAQRVVPAVNAHPDWEVVVEGISCQQMLKQSTGRPTRHLIEVFRDALE